MSKTVGVFLLGAFISFLVGLDFILEMDYKLSQASILCSQQYNKAICKAHFKGDMSVEDFQAYLKESHYAQ